MPNVHVPLPESTQNISRPAAIEVIKQVQKITQMKDCPVYFPGDGEKMSSVGGTIDKMEDRYIKMESSRNNFVVVKEEVDEDTLSPTFFDGKEYPAVFEDIYIGLRLTPIYAKHNVTITFSYRCPSKTEAQRWYQEMRMAVSRLRGLNAHVIHYQFNVDSRLFGIIYKAWELRETQGGYGTDFETYFEANATPRLTKVGVVTGGTSIYAVAEKQGEIYGKYSFEAVPEEPTRDADTGMWEIGFDYTFDYDKPIGTTLKYPIVVHNLPMPVEWLDYAAEPPAFLTTALSGSMSQIAMMHFRQDYEGCAAKPNNGPIRIPQFDDFWPEGFTGKSSGILQALCTISTDNLKDLVDLHELGDAMIDPDVMQFLEEVEYPYLTSPYLSIFNLSVYQNRQLQSHNRFTVNSGLMLSSTQDLNIRYQYRVRFSVLCDLDMVAPAAIERLRQYPKVLYKVVCAINQGIMGIPELNGIGDLPYVTKCDFSYIYRVLTGREAYQNYGSGSSVSQDSFLTNYDCISQALLNKIRIEYRRPALVQTTAILAMRREALASPS